MEHKCVFFLFPQILTVLSQTVPGIWIAFSAAVTPQMKVMSWQTNVGIKVIPPHRHPESTTHTQVPREHQGSLQPLRNWCTWFPGSWRTSIVPGRAPELQRTHWTEAARGWRSLSCAPLENWRGCLALAAWPWCFRSAAQQCSFQRSQLISALRGH